MIDGVFSTRFSNLLASQKLQTRLNILQQRPLSFVPSGKGGSGMENLASPSEPGKRALRNTIEHEVQLFLDQGGKITVFRQPSSDAARFRGSLWHDEGDEVIHDE
jgi:hypothetical protein